MVGFFTQTHQKKGYCTMITLCNKQRILLLFLLLNKLFTQISFATLPTLEEATIKELYLDFDISMQHGFSPHEYAMKLGSVEFST